MSDLDNLSDEELEAILAVRKEAKFKRYSELADYMLECERWIEELDAAYKEDEERYKVYTLSTTGIIDTRDGAKLKLKLSSYYEPYVTVMRKIQSRIHNFNTHEDQIDVDDWPACKEMLPDKIVIDPNIDEYLKSYKKAPNYKVSKDEKNYYLETSSQTKSYEIRRIPGCTLDDRYNRWKFPLPEAWRILNTMNAEETKGCTVEWTGDSKTFAEAQYEKRLMLDVIAKKEKPEQDIYLNSHKLHDYQAVEVEFIEAAGGSGILGPEMGLGKTPISIAVAERMCERGEGNIILVVYPAALIPNWQRQLFKFTNLYAYRYTGENPNQFDVAMSLTKKYRYWIINYDILSTETLVPEEKRIEENGDEVTVPAYKRRLWVEVLSRYLKPDMIIYDEGHYMQNVSSKRSEAGRELAISIPRRVILSGTIFTSYAPQLWPNISIVSPEIAGGYESFIKYYTIDGKAARNIEQLRDILRPILIRHTKKGVIKELPPINRVIREVELSPKARKIYDKAYNDGLLVAIDNLGEVIDTQAIPGILAQLMILKQICVEDKYEYIADLATQLYDESENGHRKVIVFSQFVNSPPVIASIRNRLGHEAISFSGEDQVEERMKIVDKFQTSPDVQYLVCSIKAAGEGLDITAAGHVIFTDLMWTPASHHQAEARAYGRLNDLHNIDSYYVIADNTIENDIMDLLAKKLNTFEAIIDGSGETRMDSSIAMDLIRALKDRRGKLKLTNLEFEEGK